MSSKIGALQTEKIKSEKFKFKPSAYGKFFFWACTFLFLFIFFTEIHPLVIYDSDDWSNISYVRQAYPLWKDWNPCRVFPETFLPFIAYIAAFLVKPLVHDYLLSMTLTFGFVISAAIFIYLILFWKWIKVKFKATDTQAIVCTLAFLLFHFSILKNGWAGNSYLFFSENVTCYFYYVLPNLMNAGIVLWFMAGPTDLNTTWNNGNLLKKGCLILLIYLSILSNLFPTIILISYIGYNFLLAFISFIKKRQKTVWEFIKENLFSIVCIGFWLISLVYEAAGERSASIASSSIQIKETLNILFAYLYQLNRMTCRIFILAVGIAIVTWIRSKNKREIDKYYRDTVIETLICTVVVTIFLVLLCGVSGSGYLSRTDVSFGIFFYGFLFVTGSFIYVLQEHPKTTLAVPLILYIVLMDILVGEQIFRESNMGSLNSKVCISVSQDLIDQMVKADQEGKTEMTLYVPVGNGKTDDNWPHAKYMGYSVSRTLCRHGIISQIIDVDVEPAPEMNEKYHIVYSK